MRRRSFFQWLAGILGLAGVSGGKAVGSQATEDGLSTDKEAVEKLRSQEWYYNRFDI